MEECGGLSNSEQLVALGVMLFFLAGSIRMFITNRQLRRRLRQQQCHHQTKTNLLEQ